MRPLLAALSALALLTPQADAAGTWTVAGTTCGLAALEAYDVTGQGFEGVLFGAAVGVDTGETPVTMSMTCRLLVEHVPLNTESSPVGTGAAAVLAPIAFQAFPERRYSVCTTVTATSSGDTRTISDCAEVVRGSMPPQEVCDVLPVCPLVPGVNVMYVVPRVLP